MTSSIPDPPLGNEVPFAGPRAKIKRATRFIDELTAEFERYRQSGPYSASMVSVGGEPQIRIDWKGIGDDAGAILGDAIHNLRVSLDQTASELARINGRSDKDVYFPFADAADTLDDAIKRRQFEKAGDDAVTLLRSIAPYRGGNDALRAVHDLDIRDKHSGLIPTTQIHDLHIEGAYDIDDPLSGAVNVAGEVIFTFPEGTALAGQEILETLKHLVQVVDGVVEAFANLVAARS